MAVQDRVLANVRAAHKLAAHGIAIFPAKVWLNLETRKWDKKPHVKGWQDGAATTDLAKIDEYWRQFPDALPALCTHDFIIVDPDRHPDAPDGVVAWDQLVEK